MKTALGIERTLLMKLGEERLLDFEALRAAGRFHSAIYMGGYALEAFLKCCICKRLDSDKLPKVFEFHDLENLLFFAGLKNELNLNSSASQAFEYIEERWLDATIRYEDPADKRYDAFTCSNMHNCLHDPQNGVISWLKLRS